MANELGVSTSLAHTDVWRPFRRRPIVSADVPKPTLDRASGKWVRKDVNLHLNTFQERNGPGNPASCSQSLDRPESNSVPIDRLVP